MMIVEQKSQVSKSATALDHIELICSVDAVYSFLLYDDARVLYAMQMHFFVPIVLAENPRIDG